MGGPLQQFERVYIHSDLGTLIQVTAIFYGPNGVEESNQHMEREDNEDAVLAVHDDRIYLARVAE